MFGPYEREQVETWAADFADSTAYRELGGLEKQYAVQIVAEFLRRACAHENAGPADITEAGASEALLNHLPSLALPDRVRPFVPEIVRDALTHLEDTGRLGDGAHLGRVVMAAAQTYREKLAPGGGGKLKPIVRPAEKIGRNDPCPCGSGAKFKKCCGR
jgi:hypothetical protein